ncbi:hypothetical protein ECXG_03969 [Escherichia coli TA447]|uniref:Uncharacterized protein n=1 Tax=Escherichia coli TA447 TaxID=656447 RepID=A0A1X3J6B4_ECOLX|nr:hypothetical protein ECXG_03969 [Escherichia coli TA447]
MDNIHSTHMIYDFISLSYFCRAIFKIIKLHRFRLISAIEKQEITNSITSSMKHIVELI